MNAARLGIRVRGYRALAENISINCLEETIRKLPEEAAFVRSLFSLPPWDLKVDLFLLTARPREDGKRVIAETYGPSAAKRIGIGFAGEFGPCTPFSRHLVRIHELAHAYVLNYCGHRVPTEVNEGIAEFTELSRHAYKERHGRLDDIVSPKVLSRLDPSARFCLDIKGGSGGFRFFKKIVDGVGPAAAFRSVVTEVPRESELTRPSHYLRRLGGRFCIFLENMMADESAWLDAPGQTSGKS